MSGAEIYCPKYQVQLLEELKTSDDSKGRLKRQDG